MSMTPVLVLLIVTSTLTFEGLLYGNEIAGSMNFPTITANPGTCQPPPQGNWFTSVANGVGYIACWIAQAFLVLVQFIWMLISCVVFFFQLITFNVPGAPSYVRILLFAGLGGATFWSMITLIRGTPS